MALAAPFRLLLVAMVAIGMQICCCGTAALSAACALCGDPGLEPTRHTTPVHACHGHPSEHGLGSHTHDDDQSAFDGHPAPSHDPHQDGPCTCWGNGKGPVTFEKPGKVKLPSPVVVAVLSRGWEPEPGLPAAALFRRSDAAEWAPTPVTSLLRLHCALTV
jgi:hypothetical protein